MRERLPQLDAAIAGDKEDGLAAGLVLTVVDAVVGVVRKQSMVRVPAAGGERSGAGNEHPLIGIAHDAHQKRRHRIAVDDAVKALAADLNLLSLYLARAGIEGRSSNISRSHRIRLDLIQSSKFP